MSTTDHDEPLRTGVLVPIRSFDDAKSRLAGVLDAERRHRLAVDLADRVVAAAHPFDVRVVSEDPDVARWARDRGAGAMSVGLSGLVASVTAAVELMAADGFDRAIVAHADLALVEDLSVMDGPGLVIAPDRHRDGSNVMCVPTRAGFGFAYGPGSFLRHLREAHRLGLPVRVVDDATLAVDVDEPDDLRFVTLAEEPAS